MEGKYSNEGILNSKGKYPNKERSVIIRTREGGRANIQTREVGQIFERGKEGKYPNKRGR